MNPDDYKAKMYFTDSNGEQKEIGDIMLYGNNIELPAPKADENSKLAVFEGEVSGTFKVVNMTAKTMFYKLVYGKNHWIKRFLKYIFDRL